MLTLCDDVDLTKDVFSLVLWQDGNLMSTKKQENFEKVKTVYMRMTMSSPTGDFNENWNLHGAYPNNWDYQVKKIFQETADMKKILKGKYVLDVNLQSASEGLPEPLRKVSLRVTSPVAVSLEIIPAGQGVGISSAGQLETYKKDMSCKYLYKYLSQEFGFSLQDATKAAVE